MNVIYYIETNLTCIVLILMLRQQMRRNGDGSSTERLIFRQVLWATVALCISDMAAGILRGMTFSGARALIEASNIIFFVMMTAIGYLWTLYVELHISKSDAKAQRRKQFILSLPLIAFIILAATNPFTHILFTVDESNQYARNYGVYIHWAISWSYLIYPTVRTAVAMSREKSRARRKELSPLLYFIIAPIISSVVQMLFYGVSSTQVGMTVSIVAIFLMEQSGQIGTDTLTGLNNRRGLDRYLADCIQSRDGEAVCVIMVDLNNFKQVNDRFGHLSGDHALADTAGVLKRACEAVTKRVFLCRFGGDEFLIVGKRLEPADIDALRSSIAAGLHGLNEKSGHGFALSVGIGAASGVCATMEDAERLIHEADEAMYEDKARLKAADKVKQPPFPGIKI